MSNRKPTIKRKTKWQLTKEELEHKKLELEIKDLERPFWKRPTYILAALPTLLAVVTLSVGLFNGYFSASLTKLENQKHDLQVEVTNFKAERDELYSTNKRVKTENELLVAEKELIEAKLSEVQQNYEAQVAALKTKWTEVKKNNKSLSLKNNDLFQEKKEQEYIANKKINDIKKEIERLQASLREASGQRIEVGNTDGPGPRCIQ